MAKTEVSLRLATIDEDMRIEQGKVKKPWVKDKKGQVIFGLAVFANSAFIGIELQVGVAGFNLVFWLIESAFLITFIIEICLRLQAEKPHYCKYFNAWGIFDVIVTFLGCVDAWIFVFWAQQDNPFEPIAVVRMFRMLRLVRLLRVFRMFGKLIVLLSTLAGSARAVGWMSTLLGMLMYTSSIITVELIGKPHHDNPEVTDFFGGLATAFFSHFTVVTLEGWANVANAAMKVNKLWGIYFMSLIVLLNFALANLMVGVIVEKIIHISVEEQEEAASFAAESEQFRTTLRALFNAADFDSSGDITRAEVRQLMSDQRTREVLDAFGVNVNIPPDALHTIMGMNDEGLTSFDEFFNACIRMCGSKQKLNSIFLQQNVCDFQQETQRRMSLLERSLNKVQQVVQDSKPLHTTPAAQLPPEDELAVRELLGRMDKFSQTQGELCAEMHAIKVATGLLSRRDERGRPFGGKGPMVLDNAGHEVQQCCGTNVFNLAPPAAGGELRAAAKKDHKVEFRGKHPAGR